MGSKNPLKTFTGKEKDQASLDVHQWLRAADKAATCFEWKPEKKLAMAMLSLEGPAADWLDTFPDSDSITWEEFKQGLVERFGEEPQEVIDKLTARKQWADESVRAFTDDYTRLLAKAETTGNKIPAQLQLKGYIDALRHPLQGLVCFKHPETLDEAIKEAKYFEANQNRSHRATAALAFGSSKRDMTTSNGYNNTKSNGYSNNNHQPDRRGDTSRKDYSNKDHSTGRRDNHYSNDRHQRRNPDKPSNWPPSADKQPQQQIVPAIDDLTKKLEKMEIKLSEFSSDAQFNQFEMETLDDYPDPYDEFDIFVDIEMPDAEPLDRRPRARQGFDPNSLKRSRPTPNSNARDQTQRSTQRPTQTRGFQPEDMHRRSTTRTNAPGPPPAPPAAPRPTPTQPTVQPPTPQMPPVQRRPAAKKTAFNVVEHMKSTSAKITLAELMQVAPSIRKEVADFLQTCNRSPNVEAYCATSEPAAEVYNAQHGPPLFQDESPVLTGGRISTLKTQVEISGYKFSAIVDSGATHCCMTDVLAKKLLLYNRIRPCKKSFKTASGASSMPMGIIYNVDVTLGSVTLPVDVFITQASNYWMLLGNSFLAPMGVQIDFTNGLLTYHTGPSTTESIFLDYQNTNREKSTWKATNEETLGNP